MTTPSTEPPLIPQPPATALRQAIAQIAPAVLAIGGPLPAVGTD
ncbi:hypothetical protein [Streptomyces sp. RTd22]|nr:hypothetical protein [Streptomyces sp. RTd22]